MLTLNKFTEMRDDEMMISVSVKTTRMYANGFNTPKDNCLNSGIWIYLYFDFWEFIFFFIFSEKKKIPGNCTKILEKNAGMLYKSLRRGKLFRLNLFRGTRTCMVAFLLLMALLRSAAQKAPEV